MLRCTVRAKAVPLLLGALLLLACARLTSFVTGGTVHRAQAVPLFENLGGVDRPITTQSPLAQRYFNQGLALTFGFNHEQAVRMFREAARLDPDCAACFWGIALALGPNINAPMGPDAERQAHAAAKEALARKGNPQERALSEALAVRYDAQPVPGRRAELDRAYADAMRDVHRRFPDDLHTATLFAESLMDLYPWDYWDDEAKPREFTEELVRTLEAVLAREPTHIGANHYYIHAMEEFTPERAEAAADRLATLAGDAGHLIHMPSHIYFRLGRYGDAVRSNELAIASDEAFLAWCRSGGLYPALYYNHNLHFLWASASARGQGERALLGARKLEQQAARYLAEFPPVEEFLTTSTQTLVRFGRFDQVLGLPEPAAEQRYGRGVWHYARGLAFARRGSFSEARGELEALRQIRDESAQAELRLAGGTATAATLLGISAHHLSGELAFEEGDLAGALGELELAVRAQDSLAYMEPPPFFFPTRQALGATLLSGGRPEEAEAVYRADLRQNPQNGWSLFGLVAALEAQGKTEEAQILERARAKAWADADVTLRSSRF